jgi:hypothetical protein
MMFKKTIVACALVLSVGTVVAAINYAVLALSVIPTLAFYYATEIKALTKSVVTAASKEITVYFPTLPKSHPDAPTEAQVAAQLGAIAPNVPATASGPFSLVIPVSSWNTSGSAKVITGSSPGDFLQKIAVCPSNVCSFGGNVASIFSPDRQRMITSITTGVWTTTAVPSMGYAAPYQGSGYARFVAPGVIPVYIRSDTGPECSPGYTMNPANFKCDLTDIEQARKSGANDGVCFISEGRSSPFDKDCIDLKFENKLAETTDGQGKPVAVVNDKDGDGEIVAARPQDDGGTDISRTFPTDANGNQRREDTPIDKDGRVGPTSNANYPTPNPPLYPGDPGGTAIPGGVGTGTSSAQCGGPGQTPCATRIVDANGNDVKPITAGDPVGGISDSASGSAQAKLDAVKSKISISVSATCPQGILDFVMPLPDSAGGDYHVTDNGVICQIGDTYGSTIRMLSIAIAWIGALYIVLRA